jgi:hypothetical protein
MKGYNMIGYNCWLCGQNAYDEIIYGGNIHYICNNCKPNTEKKSYYRVYVLGMNYAIANQEDPYEWYHEGYARLQGIYGTHEEAMEAYRGYEGKICYE